MRFNKENRRREILFGVFCFLLAYIFFYLTTHKRPPLTLSFAVGFVVFGLVTNLVLKRSNRSLYLIFLLLPLYPFIRIQILRFQIVGHLVMFAVSRWTDFLMFLSMLGRKLGGIRRIFYSAPILDLLIFSYVLVGLGYFIQSLKKGDWVMGMWGIKEQFLFFLFYFLVRFIPLAKEDMKKILTYSALVATVIAAFGCIQAQFFGEDLLLKLGYGVDFRGTGFTYIDPTYSREFPGGISFVRAISILQDALSLGAYLMVFLLILHPFYFLPEDRRHKGWKHLQYLILLMGLLYTTTRSAWIGTTLGILFLAWRRKRLLLTVGIFLVLGIFFVFLLLSIPGGYEFLEGSLFTGKESSAAVHWSKYGWQFRVMLDNPLGIGLGMTGRVGVRFGTGLQGGFSTECWYLQVGTQMGFPGFILYIAIVLETLRKLFLLGARLRDPFLRDLANGIFAAYLGCTIFGIFLNVWSCHVIPIFMHLFIGIALFHLPAWDTERKESLLKGPSVE